MAELKPHFLGLARRHFRLQVTPVAATALRSASSAWAAIDKRFGASVLQHDVAWVVRYCVHLEPAPIAASAASVQKILPFHTSEAFCVSFQADDCAGSDATLEMVMP